MKTKRWKSVLALLLAIAAAVIPSFSANANAAPIRSYEGTLHTGALAIDSDCPLTVDSELLTFNIQSLPDDRPEGVYSADLSAEYRFFNPADADYTATLAFPFGTTDVLFAESDRSITEGLSVSIDGESTEAELRFTYFPNNGADFFTGDELSKIREGYAKDDFFSPDTPVCKITYHLKRSPGCNFANLDLSESRDPSFRIMGSTGVHFGYSDIQEIVIYIIGTTPTDLPEWEFYEDSDLSALAEGEVTVISTEQMTFGCLALSMRDAESPVSEADWYNAVLDALNGPAGHPEYSGEHTYYEGLLNVSHSLLAWLVYDMTVPAKSFVTNKVSTPIYPYYDHTYDPVIYSYKYLLSPAKEWSDFGSLKVVINTPYYLIDSELEGFEKTDSGYVLELEALPEGELVFDLCKSENPTIVPTAWTYLLWIVLAVAAALLISACVAVIALLTLPIICAVISALVVALITVLTVTAIRRRRKKKRQTDNE